MLIDGHHHRRFDSIEQSLPGRVVERHRIRHVETQHGARMGAVGMLATRPTRRPKAPLELGAGNHMPPPEGEVLVRFCHGWRGNYRV